MKEVKKVDPYLDSRISITKNMDHAYLLEVGGLCPLCGKNLLAAKGNSKTKLYEIAHIYPNSPLPEQTKELYGIDRLGISCEDFENKIALCKDCHGIYDDHVTKAEYISLVDVKKRLMSLYNAKVSTSHQSLEDEIIIVINSLNTIDEGTIQKLKLKYNGVEIADKFESSYMILKNKIEAYTCSYYFFIKEIFQNIEQTDKVHFNIIASEIKISFLKCEKELANKSEIFYSLVSWLQSQTNGASTEACEVVISFFVQNCEVFHEITK